ncbi:histone-lysine N-methyltransferase SETD2-like [Physeter macrocephalus]|uniref:Histone-lysine N-methyltransferase SETD2-like n=1 Tax=Physeter macrocephalus TaxID=9755 RepID=A0A9W2WZB8_PHYMC|nr:histone-lysine N-methyltransferase SETD2-like [Physeter catodon]
MQHSKSESPFRETEPPVLPHQDKLISLPVMTIDYSKTIVKEPVDVRVSCCKTKDSDIYCTSNDNRPSLCHSGAENTEPLVTKISSNSFMNVHLKSKTVICDNGSLTDQHSKFAYGEYKQSVGSTSSASVNHFDDLYQPTGSSCIASSIQSLPPGIKVDSLTLLQCGENTSPVLDAVLKSKSSEFLKHSEKEIIEVGSGLPDSGRGFASWENRHNNGLSGKCVQEAQEEGNSILPDRRGRPEISLDEEGGRGHAHTSDDSEVVFSSCDLNFIMEDSDGVTYTLKCDSSGHASEIVSTVHEDYSGSSESSSDESDSEDTDSHDSSIPRNRLQSVVVVPKNSTLPMEETSPCSSRSSQSYRHYSDHWEDERLEPRRHPYEEKFESIASKACPQTEKFFFHKATKKNSEISSIQPSRKQIDNHLSEIAHPQSDGVDSTSHTDIKSDPLGHPNSEETVKAKITSRQQEELPVYSSDDFEDVSSKSRQQTTFPNRPDSRLGKTESNFSSCDISQVDGFHSSEELRNLGWDFSQQEKPTTYQQPDSSYGACGGHKYQQSAEQYSGTRNYWQGNGYWDPRSAGRPPGTGVVYDRIQGQVPDSLTDDREEEENWDQRGGSHFSGQSNKFFLSLQKDKGSVQAHEISSNSIKNSLAVNEKKDLSKNLEKNDMKDRGPLTKRRQELESDSESGGELQDRKKVRVEVEQGETAVPLGSALVAPSCVMEDFRDPQRWKECAKQGKMPCYFDLIEENVYLTERKKNKSHRDLKQMQCQMKLDDNTSQKDVVLIPSELNSCFNLTERGRDAVGFRDQTVAPKTPNRSRERYTNKQTQNKEKRKRRGSLSPTSSAYERGTKRPDDRYDTPTSKKKVRIKDRNKLSTEERRKLFEQEVAQREAQKQQQQMQNLGITSPLPYDSLGYNAPHHPFAGYPPGYPMQAYVDPSHPNAGKHVITRQTQWDPPTWESPEDDASLEHEAEMDLGTPTYDENPMKTSKKPKTAEADTSSELAKKSKEVFKKEMSQFIVQCLNPYRKPDCKVGRITTTEDFKHLARKLTHGVMNKELKYCKNPEDLECNENVKHKTKEYIKKYMQKFGAVYKQPNFVLFVYKEDTELE